MSYEVRDGVLYSAMFDVRFGPVDVAVADALSVLRAAGWRVDVLPMGNDERTVALSPWREVDRG